MSGLVHLGWGPAPNFPSQRWTAVKKQYGDFDDDKPKVGVETRKRIGQ